jgi:hypothetical protein
MNSFSCVYWAPKATLPDSRQSGARRAVLLSKDQLVGTIGRNT